MSYLGIIGLFVMSPTAASFAFVKKETFVYVVQVAVVAFWRRAS